MSVDSNGAFSPLQATDVARGNAHDIVTALWHERIGKGPIKSASPKMTSLLDAAYSLGIASWATGIGLLTALPSAEWLRQALPGPRPFLRLLLLVVVGFAVWKTFRLNYWRVGRSAASLISATLMEAVLGEAGTVKTFVQG